MRTHALGRVLALLTSAITSAPGCLSQVPVADPLATRQLSIPEPPPPAIGALDPDTIGANLPDQCPPPTEQNGPSYEPQIIIVTAGALPLIILDPDYPANAADRCVSGWAAFRFDLSHDGSVENPELVTAHPKGVFGRPSLAALRRSRFNRLNPAEGQLPGACALFLFHHPLHPLDAEAAADQFPILCPFPAPVTTIPRGPFPRGPLEALIPENPFTILE